MPFIVPLALLLNKMRLIQYDRFSKSKTFLKNFYYTRLSCYIISTPLIGLFC